MILTRFISNCQSLGAQLYGRIATALVEYGSLTDEQICNYGGILRIDLARAAIADMKSHGLIKASRVRDPQRNWFITKYTSV